MCYYPPNINFYWNPHDPSEIPEGDNSNNNSPLPPPPKPAIYCYCCGNKPKDLTIWESFEYYLITGQCCGKPRFSHELKFHAIRKDNVTSYVVNLS